MGSPSQENLGRPEEARVYAAKGVEMARALVKADAKNALARRDLAMSLVRFGTIEPAPGQESASLKALEEAQALMEPLLAANPKAADLAVALAGVLESNARRLTAQGRREEAVREYRQSLSVLEALHGADNASVLLQWIADDEGLARLYDSIGQTALALVLAKDAVKEVDRTPAEGGADERHSALLASAWATLAGVQFKAGSVVEARQSAQTALQLWESVRTAGVLVPHRRQMEETAMLLASDKCPYFASAANKNRSSCVSARTAFPEVDHSRTFPATCSTRSCGTTTMPSNLRNLWRQRLHNTERFERRRGITPA